MKANTILIELFIVSILLLSGCAQQQQIQTSVCGNEQCEYGESCGNCFWDCCLEEHREKNPGFDECRLGCPTGWTCVGHQCQKYHNPEQ